MKIDKHISALLYEHDCVIVPDFGGFVTSYAPAKVHPTQHIFSPPHKSISFNKHLKSNDGLLSNRIVQAEKKTFAEAGSIINSFVIECNGALKRGEKINIEEVGALYLDVERNIQFEPDASVNYLESAFGMTTIQSLPVKRENIEKKIEKQFIDREPIPQEKKRSRTLAYVVSSLALVIAVSLIVLSQTNVLKDINYSALNPFAAPVSPKYNARINDKPVLTSKDFESKKISFPVSDSIPLTAVGFIKEVEEKFVVRLHHDVPLKANLPDKTTVASNGIKSVKGLRYHVVSGCFKILANARNFVAMMKAKNLNAAIIGKNGEGLFIVSCGDYATKEDAYSELARIRSGNTAAWMLEQ